MSIYIKNTTGQFVSATDTDLQNRGYSSTQQLGSVPVIMTGEIKLTVTGFDTAKKVKVIKAVRKVCNEYYGRNTYTNQATTYTTQPLPQEDTEYDGNWFGLKHMKHFVETTCSLIIHTDCYKEIQSALIRNHLSCTFKEEFLKGSNNLERLQEHRAQLKEELRKTDDLIAYQLYS